MSRYIFTFGSGHHHPITGVSFAQRYALAPEGLDYQGARLWMIDHFHTKWSFQYVLEDPETQEMIAEFGLTPLTDGEIPHPIKKPLYR